MKQLQSTSTIGQTFTIQSLKTGFIMQGLFAGIRPSFVTSAEIDEGEPTFVFYEVKWGKHSQRQFTIPVNQVDDFILLEKEDKDMTSGEILDNIMKIMDLDGDTVTDDQCVIMIREMLNENGDSK
jgi:hypothetical protein